jgi:hypothetical protein
VVSIPPASTPMAPPAPVTAPNAPIAWFRSGPSGNMARISARPAGAIMAAPRPSTARAATSRPAEPARAQASEEAVNTAAPAMSILRRPSRSASRPPSSRNPPNASAYPLSTHCRPTGEKPRPRWIAGSAKVTIDPSMTTSSWASNTSPNAKPRRRARPARPPLGRPGRPDPRSGGSNVVTHHIPPYFP